MRYCKLVNIIGASTFGVLLIHANSNAMRQWLWKDLVDCVGHYNLPFSELVLFSIGVIVAIFTICTCIDYTRLKLIEEPFFKWFDKKQDIIKWKSH